MITKLKTAKIYGSNIPYNAIDQLKGLSKREGYLYSIGYPDLHGGNDFPVGYCMKTQNMIYFDLIGADIGCCVAAYKLGTVFNHYKYEKELSYGDLLKVASFVQEKFTGTRDIPSIGGGNHFFEIAHDEDNCVWFVIHTGSRSRGGELYKAFAKELRTLNLKGVHKDSLLAKSMMKEFNKVTEAARLNETAMVEQVGKEFKELIGTPKEEVFTVHNTIVVEKSSVYHYKGASRVDSLNSKAVIPMSMGAGSLIVEMNKAKLEELFYGINHGAGRKLSRGQAKRQLSHKELASLKVLHSGDILDEAPGAYKDIMDDMKWLEENDYLKIEKILKPIITVKE